MVFSFTVQLEIGDGECSHSALIIQDCFRNPVWFLCVFSYEAENWCLKVSKKLCWNFNEDCIDSVDGIWQDGHFYYINPTNPWAWDIFPSSDIFFNFFNDLKVFFYYTSLSLAWLELRQDRPGDEGKWGETWRSRGRESYNQDILYEKRKESIFNKRKKIKRKIIHFF